MVGGQTHSASRLSALTPKRKAGLTLWAAIVLFPSLASCSTVTPHENFKQHMSHNVGKRIDDPRLNWVNQRVLIGSTTLPNGNIENEYRFRETCRYFFEVDPKSRVILRWRFQGTERDCQIVP